MSYRRRNENDVIIEYIQQGSYIKVSAIDSRTGFEVSIVGDPRQSQTKLAETAIRKLRYVMRKRRQSRQQAMESSMPQDIRSTSGWDL